MAHGLEIKYKREFHPIRWTIWLIVLLLIGLGAWFGYRYFTEGELPPLLDKVGALGINTAIDSSEVTAAQKDEHKVLADRPRYLSIPSINIVNARVFSGDVDANNQLVSPKNIHDVTWYTKSMKPGQGYGVVLMNGHSEGVNKSGVFAKLKDVQKNETIQIILGNGKTVEYEVREIRRMTIEDMNSVGTKILLQSIDTSKEGLSLVAPDGKWIPAIKQYDHRILLRAVRSS